MKLRKEKTRPCWADLTLPSVTLYPIQQVSLMQFDFHYRLLQVFSLNNFGKYIVFMIGLVLRQMTSSRPNET